jgi:hypothetical protein
VAALVEEVRRMRLSACWPLELARGPQGTTLSVAPRAVAAEVRTGRPWDIVIAEDEARLYRCRFQWADAVVAAAGEDGADTLKLSLGGKATASVCAVLNTNTRAVTVDDAEPPALHQPDAHLFYKLLYSLKKSTGGWAVEVDWRMMPALPIMV